ncbi:acyl carrier protein [Nitrosomonas sp. Nm84]|uniref:acyl carrier protein n=1 Tax=Nitrosomonas sp. Nm84 TaxID=200124 RepID=UPI000D76BF81|nr:acyl carrier protein [Nitrosomonas sp. Nm84]PXW85436.1 acyl carrier protein [Nitrosomonas sp. Nm84]
MDYTTEIKTILSDILGLGERCDSITADTSLLGNIPELDSVAVVTIILALEKEFSISINDDEISAQTFQTLGTLVNFVEKKVTLENRQLR